MAFKFNLIVKWDYWKRLRDDKGLNLGDLVGSSFFFLPRSWLLSFIAYCFLVRSLYNVKDERKVLPLIIIKWVLYMNLIYQQNQQTSEALLWARHHSNFSKAGLNISKVRNLMIELPYSLIDCMSEYYLILKIFKKH